MSSTDERIATEVLRTDGGDSDTVGVGPEPFEPEIEAELPRNVGRYAIEGRLGSGGMGTVLRGWDDRLERPVAIKLLRTSRSRRSEEHRGRLLREAQALAALSHPNVVSVYEVGTHEDSVFVAMELVDGVTLRVWVEAQKREWTEVVAMLCQAGRGLVAAHAKGIVHRDFKPSNVIVGDDGRARVLDFGLATLDEDSTSMSDDESAEYAADAFADRLTMMGTVVGTPAYMAPEQFEGAVVTAKSDQFSFCVAVWEALTTQRPFSGSTIRELQDALRANERRAPPTSAVAVPQRVLDVIDRGLSRNSAQRWPNMSTLLDQLERSATRRSRLWMWTAGGLLVGGAALCVAVVSSSRSQCDAADDEWRAVWNEETRASLQPVGGGTVSDAQLDAVARLDDYGEAWIDAYNQVCAGRAKAPDARTFDLQMTCLRQRTQTVQRALTVLDDAGNEALERAAVVVAGFPSVAACIEARDTNPATSLPDNIGEAQAVSELRGRLDATEAMATVGKLDEAATESEEVLAQAGALEFAPLVVEAQLRLGIVQSRRGRLEDARRILDRAFWAASEIPYDAVGSEAAIELAWLVGYLEGEHADGVEWMRHYETITRRRGLDPTENAERVLGPIYFDWDKLDEAQPYLEASLERAVEHGDDQHSVAIGHMNLANLYYEQGDGIRARERFESARGLLVDLFPDGAPDTVLLDINHGGLLLDIAGDVDEAARLLDRGVSKGIEIHGEAHPTTALGLVKLAQVRSAQLRHDEAIETAERAIQAYEGVASPSEALGAASVRAFALLQAGRLDESAEQWTEILEEARGSLGADHVLTSSARYGQCLVACAKGVLDEAAPACGSAFAKVPADPRAETIRIRLTVGDVELARGNAALAEGMHAATKVWAHKAYGPTSAQAVAATIHHAVAAAHVDSVAGLAKLEKTLKRAVLRPMDEVNIAWGKFQLAKLIATSDPARAVALANEAKLRLNGLAHFHERVAVERWLAEQG